MSTIITARPETVPADDLSDAAFFAEGPAHAWDGAGLEARYRSRYHGFPVELTWRQEAFCRYFVILGNGAEAARRAGYSVRNARQQAWENLRKSPIRQRVAHLRDGRVAEVRQERQWLAVHYMLAHEEAMAGSPGVAGRIRALDRMAVLAGHSLSARGGCQIPSLAPLLPADVSPEDPDLPDHARDPAFEAQHAFAGDPTRGVLFYAVDRVLGAAGEPADVTPGRKDTDRKDTDTTDPDKTLHPAEISGTGAAGPGS